MTLEKMKEQIATHQRIIESQMNEIRELVKDPVEATLRDAKRIADNLDYAFSNLRDAVANFETALDRRVSDDDEYEEEEGELLS